MQLLEDWKFILMPIDNVQDTVKKIYLDRFETTGLNKRDRVWKVLCANFFQRMIGDHQTILDIACGYGEFINNIKGKRKFAIDINPDSPRFLNSDVEFHSCLANDLQFIPDNSLDVAFTSNFLEHLPDKNTCDIVLGEVLRKLRPGGRFIILGPNIRYAYKEYWDFYDHYLALSDKSLTEGLRLAGFKIRTVHPRFLPYTMNNRKPTSDFIVNLYLRMPLAWRLFGKQFLVEAEKP